VRHFLYLTNTRLVSLVAQGKRIVARREFAVSGAGAAAFEAYLANLRDTRTHLFVDLAEEDFRLDTIPHVGAGDRQAILNRKLTQIFRNTPFRYAHVQGRETEGRRDDRVIYTAITNAEVMRPWLDAIERLKVPLAGIHSTSVFSATVLEELDLIFSHTLLVTFTPGDAMRQSYFRDREIKFSRLTPIDLQEGQTLGTMVAEETTRTWQYLDSLRHFTPEDRLEVCIIIHANDRASVQASLRDFAQIQYRLLDIGHVARKLGLKPPPLGSSAEEVLVHLYLLRPAPNHFASEEQRRHFTLRRARMAIVQAAAAFVAAGIAFGGFNVWRVTQSSDQDLRVTRDLASLNREYDEIARSMPSFGVGGSTMRDAVSFYNGSIRAFPKLDDFVRPVSQVLQSRPNVRLQQLAWMASDDPNAKPYMQMVPGKDSPVRTVARADAAQTPPPTDDQSPPFVSGRYEIGLFEAFVRVPRNDFRGAVETVEQLARDIAAIRGFSADVVDSPVELSTRLGLQAKFDEKPSSETMDLHFVMRVVRDRGAAG